MDRVPGYVGWFDQDATQRDTQQPKNRPRVVGPSFSGIGLPIDGIWEGVGGKCSSQIDFFPRFSLKGRFRWPPALCAWRLKWRHPELADVVAEQRSTLAPAPPILNNGRLVAWSP